MKIISMLIFVFICLQNLVVAQSNVFQINTDQGTDQNSSLYIESIGQNRINSHLTLDELIFKRDNLLNNGLSVQEIDEQIEQMIIINNNDITGNNTKAAPVNDNCASATNITIGNPLICGQTTAEATLQGGETVCVLVGGATERTVWYRFTATNDSLVLSLLITNTTNCVTYLGLFGPFATGAGCLPGAGSNIFCLNTGTVDPGLHKLLTGLTIGSDYLIVVEGLDCGGPNAPDVTFCIGMANPAVNSTAGGASTISACGSGFTGNTNIGNYPSGSSAGFNNLDNNAATTVGGAGEAGDDVTFIINNDSWFKFCAVNAGTWQMTINGIGGCALPAPPNQGIQAALFTGSSASLTNIYSFPSPMAVGSSNTSPVFAVAAGQCVYVVVDGFAGDACNYNLTLTNVTGGCLLPIELVYFDAYLIKNTVLLKWTTASEYKNDYFTLEKSKDGVNFEFLSNVKGAGNSNQILDYSEIDNQPYNGISFYRLKQTDYDGKYSFSDLKTIKFASNLTLNTLNIFNDNLNQQVQVTFNGTPGSEYNYRIFDITGRSIFNGSITVSESAKGSDIINTNNLSSGVYSIIINDNETVLQQKLIITK